MSSQPLRISDLYKTFHLGLFAPIPWAKNLQLGALNRVVEAVKGISFEVDENEIFGLLGANGAGKSTTIKTVMGLMKPSSGQVHLNGILATHPKARLGVGYLPENPTFYDELSPLETLELFGALCAIPAKNRRAEALKQLSRVGMSHASDRPLRLLSKGMHQRVGIAQALLGQPKLLILDEPLSGLDPVGRKEIRDLLLEERARGASILLSSHILPDVEALCDRFAMIDQGKLKYLAPMNSLLTHKEHMEINLSAVSSELTVALVKLGAQILQAPNRTDATTRFNISISLQSQVLELILSHQAQVLELHTSKLSLDELFERLVKGETLHIEP